MELLSKKDYYNSLAKKPMGADVLFLNEENKMLVVKPNYKDEWLLPGGTVESGESPKDGAIREIKEEIGLDIEIQKMLCLDYSKTTEGDNLKFVFFGGMLNSEQIGNIRLQETELLDFKFVTMEEASKLFGPRKIKRIPHCFFALENNTVAYLENGDAV